MQITKTCMKVSVGSILMRDRIKTKTNLDPTTGEQWSRLRRNTLKVPRRPRGIHPLSPMPSIIAPEPEAQPIMDGEPHTRTDTLAIKAQCQSNLILDLVRDVFMRQIQIQI
jgi:hypothetical protein